MQGAVSRLPALIEDARRVLAAYPETGENPTLKRWSAGLINDTFAVETEGGSFVLQRVHPVFAPEIHENILAVTEHLAAKGVSAPRLCPTADGRAWVEHQGEVWRLMTRLPGVSFEQVSDPKQAESAAFALGRFHHALADVSHTFVGCRVGVHDTAAHLAALQKAVETHREHRLYAQIAPLAASICERAQRLPRLVGLPERIVHGDPKFNNVLFASAQGTGAQTAVGWIDLDTVGPMALHLELGDAWRSWCNPRGENSPETTFRLDVFEASLHGYARANPFALDPLEKEALVHGVEWITLELSARFACDALVEAYFGWDSSKFPGRGEHNAIRALSQWSLHEHVLAERSERADRLRSIIGS